MGRADERTSGRAWRKASASGSSGSCVEVAWLPDGGRAVRDSKDPSGPHLKFTAREWAAFIDGVSKGEFEDEL
ncbi:DUF397 domain-containing protein [Catenulispora sp. EB89]|uniref:DUF397 domain-containing protein n=1 Tax=Catenulispora sp. EB89 TaxID=3156257 RepID=UPI0035140BBB